ncbi:MAG: carbohydrate porin, partial [Candidatus Binatia bacterium]
GRTKEIFPFYPLAAPGVYLRLSGSEKEWIGHVGVYTADGGDDTVSTHGFDWTFDNGVSFLGEIHTRRTVSGRRGKYGVGVAATTADLENFKTGGTAGGGYGLYGLIDQDVTVAGSSGPRLGVFVRSYGAPQPERQLNLWYVDLGLKLSGLIAGRGEDVVTLGFAHLAFSPDYVDSLRADGSPVSRRQSVLEAAYRAQITGWLTLQPDLQVFFDPHFSRRDAIVIGLRVVMDL